MRSGILNILVVDDDLTIVRALTRRLARAGHAVIGCTDARAALDELARTRIDVLITDLHLGSESGSDLVREVIARSPTTRAIILTGEDVVLGSLPGLALQKPVRGTQLLRVITAA